MIPNPLDVVKDVAETAMSKLFGLIIDGFSWLLGQIFGLIDKMTVFDVSTTTVPGPNGMPVKSPIADLWPWMFWLGIILAVAMFGWALMSGLIRRDGRSFATAAFGVVEFAVVTACYVAVISVLVEMSEVISSAILGLVAGPGTGADNQWSAVQLFDSNTAQMAEGGAAMVVMALISFVAIFFGIVLYAELAMRPAMVLVLVVTSPIAAAGLITHSTRRWMKLTFTWTIGVVFAKPLIAMMLVIAVTLLKWSPGLAGLFGATAMLCAAVLCPWALFRLLSFAQETVGTNAHSKGATRNMVTAGTSKVSGHSGGVSGNSSPGVAAHQQATSSRLASAAPGGGGNLMRSAANGLHNGYSAMNRMAQSFTEQMDTSNIGPHIGPADTGGPAGSHQRPAGRPRSGHGSSGGHSASSAMPNMTGASRVSGGMKSLPAPAQKAITAVAENPEIAVAAL